MISIILQTVLTTIYLVFMWACHVNYKSPKDLIHILYENGSTSHWTERKVKTIIEILAGLSTLVYVLFMLILGVF